MLSGLILCGDYLRDSNGKICEQQMIEHYAVKNKQLTQH